MDRVLAALAGIAVSLPATALAQVTYDQNVRPDVFLPHCLGCHSSTKTGAARNGAPAGVNFDTYTLATQGTNETRAVFRVVAGTMPPAGGLSTALRNEMQAWQNGGFLESPPNLPPVANAGADQNVAEGSPVILDGTGSSDPDGTITTYAWVQMSGPPVTLTGASTPQASFTAPAVAPAGASMTFQLSVTDDAGGTASDVVIVDVSNVNVAPNADAGPDQNVEEAALVTLDGTGSVDPDGTIASYSWIQVSGPPVSLSSTSASQPTFTAPAFAAALEFDLTVVDDGGLGAIDRVLVNASSTNLPPVADAGPDQTVGEGVLVTLDGSGSTDPDDSIASYGWSQISGPFVEIDGLLEAQPTFTAPIVGAGGALIELELQVADVDGGLAATDRVIVNVTNGNEPPWAIAGPSQTALQGTVVMLDGSGSFDPDGEIASHCWQQTAGPPQSLSESCVVNPELVAKGGDHDVTLTFELTVLDDGGLGATDEVFVSVPGTSPAGGCQVVAVPRSGFGGAAASLAFALAAWARRRRLVIAS